MAKYTGIRKRRAGRPTAAEISRAGPKPCASMRYPPMTAVPAKLRALIEAIASQRARSRGGAASRMMPWATMKAEREEEFQRDT